MVIEMTMKCLVLACTVIIALNSRCSLALDGGDSLLQGDSLVGNQTIISENGTFELGFFGPRGNSNWYIGIWYARISPKVIVWVANRDNPVRSMPGLLNFSSDGHLRLFDGKGRSVWSIDPGVKGSKAMITDAGNFIMLGHGQKISEIVWESFAHPTDTWLPGMKLWKGMKLTSWKSSEDPTTGLFSLQMDTFPGKTQMLMVYNNSVPYWSSGEWTGNYFANVPEVYSPPYSPNRFQLSCERVSPSRIYLNLSLWCQGNTLTGRVLLTENGKLKLLDLMDDGTWTQPWSTNNGQCSKFDICGANGLCNSNDVCSCVEGFKPKSDNRSWVSSGCDRQTPLRCSTDVFLESEYRKLPEGEAVPYKNEQTIQGCRTACLNNCSCTAFAFLITDLPLCRLWFGNLFKMSVSPDSQSIFIRLDASELPSKRSGKAPPLYILLPSLAVCCLVLSLLLATISLWKCRRQRKTGQKEEVPIMLKTFTYKELRIATSNFKHELGSGAFGSVFKGTLMDSTLVAVKRLEGSAREEKQFRAEINTIGRIQHVNLVRLCGFCVEGCRRLLVYAYMPNGSLNSSLFSVEKAVLDWKTRFEIALGIARGLVYLHEECRDQIIHCDIKPENILLDDSFSPKIADFGLAKVVGRDFSRVLTTTRGTRGYLAPEWISGLPITPKVDVYSFGMTLLEIISGRRNLDLKVEESRWYFPTWASSQIQRGNVMGIVDARIAGEVNIEEVRRVAVVGGLCIQDDENQRPSMSEVVKMLEGNIEPPHAPQFPRSLQVLLDQVEDNKSDVLFQHPCTSSGSAPTQQWF